MKEIKLKVAAAAVSKRSHSSHHGYIPKFLVLNERTYGIIAERFCIIFFSLIFVSHRAILAFVGSETKIMNFPRSDYKIHRVSKLILIK